MDDRKKLLEDFKTCKEKCDTALSEVNDILHVELDNTTLSVVKEDYNQVLKDIKIGRTDLRTVFKKLVFAANDMKSALKVHYGMSKDLNDLLVQVKDIYEHNRLARFKHRNDRIDCELYNTVSYNKSDGKTYRGVYPSIADLNPDWVIQQLNRICADIDNGDKDDLEFAYNDTMRQINGFIAEKPYSSMFVASMKVTKYHDVRFGEAVRVLLANTEVFYDNIKGMNYILDQQILFINGLDQGYKTFSSRCKGNEEKMKYVDEIFTKCAEFMNKVLNYDNVILEVLTQVYKKTAEQLIDLKQVLEQ